MKYLVTGGTGFIGSALVGRLLDDGHEVRVLDDMSRGVATRLTGLGCEIVHGDVRQPHDVAEALHGCDSVAHLAYLQGTQTFYAEPRQVLDVAVRGITNVLAACESQHVGDLLLVSSSEAYQVPTVVPTPETVPLSVPDPLNPRYSYGGGKIISELMAIAWAQTGTTARSTTWRLGWKCWSAMSASCRSDVAASPQAAWLSLIWGKVLRSPTRRRRRARPRRHSTFGPPR